MDAASMIAAGIGLPPWMAVALPLLAVAGGLALLATVAWRWQQADGIAEPLPMPQFPPLLSPRMAATRPIKRPLIEQLVPENMPFGILLALTLAASTWLLGLGLTPDRTRFLESPEWQFQPLYVVAHLVTLGTFIRVYATNYRSGIGNLAIPPGEVDGWGVKALGWRGMVAAAIIALPFCASDFRYLISDRYPRLSGTDTPSLADLLMWAIWSAEWFINAFIWVILVGFLYKNSALIKRYPFIDPIEIVVHDRKYRPFLHMSAQGASIVLVFSGISVAYIWYTGGELTDYLGLIITLILLIVGFIVPWHVLRSKVRKTVRNERHGLLQQVYTKPIVGFVAATPPTELESLRMQVDSMITFLRLQQLESLHLNLGETEFRSILLRLSAPLATIAWQTYVHWPQVVEMINRAVQTFWARLGVMVS